MLLIPRLAGWKGRGKEEEASRTAGGDSKKKEEEEDEPGVQEINQRQENRGTRPNLSNEGPQGLGLIVAAAENWRAGSALRIGPPGQPCRSATAGARPWPALSPIIC